MVHPFDDGNGRVAYVALQAAMSSQGLRLVNFAGVRAEHDRSLGAALVAVGEPDYAPLALAPDHRDRLLEQQARADEQAHSVSHATATT